jgi:hypothetical protein
MRLRELLAVTLTEAAADTKDVLQISQKILDWMYKNNAIAPGTVIDVDLIPGLTATTPEGQTLINSTRVKVVSPSVFKSKTTMGDAAPYYSDSSGNYIQGTAPVDDARMSKKIRQGKTPLLDPNSYDTFSDYISARGKQGEKMTIRLNADIVNSSDGQKRIQSTLTHELGHHLDTIKGADTIAIQRHSQAAKDAELQLHHHRQALRGEKVATTLDGKLILPARAPIQLSPKHEKHLIGIVKKAPTQVPGNSNMAYWKNTSEVNARLMEAAEDIADWVPTVMDKRNADALDSAKIDELIRYVLNKNQVTIAFVEFASEAEFQAALSTRRLTSNEIKQAYANPEFRKIYNRMYKFLEYEMGRDGLLSFAVRTYGFKFWNQSLPAPTAAATRAGFIDRFKKVVVQGLEVAKNVAKLVVRYNRMADNALNALLRRSLPILFSKGMLKSIPVAGAVVGVAFGIQRLIKGDVPGAGIELVSGIGSLLTAIPATAYQAARDLYGEYYTHEDSGEAAVLEYDAARDPQGTEQRVKELSDKIAAELKAGIERNRSILKNLPSTVEPNLGLI